MHHTRVDKLILVALLSATSLLAQNDLNDLIKEAVQAIWDVRVTSVNTLNRHGKVKRRGFTKGKPAAEKAIVNFHNLYNEGKLDEIWQGANQPAQHAPWPPGRRRGPDRSSRRSRRRRHRCSRSPAGAAAR